MVDKFALDFRELHLRPDGVELDSAEEPLFGWGCLGSGGFVTGLF